MIESKSPFLAEDDRYDEEQQEGDEPDDEPGDHGVVYILD